MPRAMTQVKVPHSVAKQSLDVMEAIMRCEEPPKGSQVRLAAAAKIAQWYMAQEKFLPEDIQRRARFPNTSSDIRELAAMTPEDLLTLQAKMVGKAG